jgi:hypothetical protein
MDEATGDYTAIWRVVDKVATTAASLTLFAPKHSLSRRRSRMTDRRAFIVSLAGTFAMAPFAGAFAAADPAHIDDSIPKMLPGDPVKADYGGGLVIPMNKDCLNTLWEGKDLWITYGIGISSYQGKALGAAIRNAQSLMKLFLLTLTFAPDRLEQVDGCGWRSKNPDLSTLVLGDIDLPGQPVSPVVDSLNGSMDAQNFSGASAAGTGFGNTNSVDTTGSFQQVHSVTGYILKKKDVSLDYVRHNAQLL